MRGRQRDQRYCSHGVMSVYLIQVVSEGQTEGPKVVWSWCDECLLIQVVSEGQTEGPEVV